ncbi:S46 family peptidase [Flavisphingomonas formosensis]|uniref:S46 family peptidase n=1 Tax=Flavisphingomonas formosensis TaxID=861534 RepID=UPI0018DF3F67|nr:S46 family peptidase [Sphingomonas formosensis]
MKMLPTTASGLAIALACFSLPAHADEGMWTFDAFPSAQVKAAHGFAPDAAWLDHVRLSAARLTGGCSSSLVSAQGLLLTNHHCVVDCAQKLSTADHDYMKNGFLGADQSQEQKCPGQQAEILTSIADVTPKVQAAIGAASGEALVKARDAAIAKIEDGGCSDKAKQRCQVVTLYGGGQYKLYTYRKYSDVRLVFAPEYEAAQFGGDPDNFNFPRYGLDAAFLRIYEDGKPVATPAHLRWDPRAPKPGELVFVAGNPGSTQRLFTQSQIAMRRDLALPSTEILLSELRGRLIAAMAGDAERTRTGADSLFGVENSFKAYYGMYRSLLDPTFAATLADNEQKLRTRIAADPKLAKAIGDPWAEVARAMSAYRNIYMPYMFLEARPGFTSDLYRYAVSIVRAAQEREKPDADRLPGYTQSALPLLEKELLDPAPSYPWLEELKIGFWLSKTREYLTTDHPQVKALLGRDSPENLAHALVTGTKLADPAVRAALFKGGLAAVNASDDPLIRFVLAHDGEARAQLSRYKAEVEGPVTAAQSRLAQARFAAYGDSLYPDATFTLRLSYGTVEGWNEAGRPIAPTTNFAGLFDRATGQAPYQLPARWLAARSKLDPQTVLDFSTSNDVVGGNSGSPVIASDGSVIGALFDGNIHSLGGAFGYDPRLNRSVVVSTGAVEAALRTVYPAPALVAELHAN